MSGSVSNNHSVSTTNVYNSVAHAVGGTGQHIVSTPSSNYTMVTNYDRAKTTMAGSMRTPSVQMKPWIPFSHPASNATKNFMSNTLILQPADKKHRTVKGSVKPTWHRTINENMTTVVKGIIDTKLDVVQAKLMRSGRTQIQRDLIYDIVKPILIETLGELVFGDKVTQVEMFQVLEDASNIAEFLKQFEPESFGKLEQSVKNPLTTGSVETIKWLFGKGALKNVQIPVALKVLLSLYRIDALLRQQIELSGDSDNTNSLLAHLKGNYPDSTSSTDDLVALLIFYFVAGTDTSSTSLGNAVKVLLSHPDQLEKMMEDPDKYVGPAFKETLRLHPPVRYVTRHKHTPNERNPVPVYVVDLQEANRDKDAFGEDADQFNIERYVSGNQDSATSKEPLSFSWGAHFCMGRQLALPQGEYFLEQLFSRFNLSPTSEDSLKMTQPKYHSLNNECGPLPLMVSAKDDTDSKASDVRSAAPQTSEIDDIKTSDLPMSEADSDSDGEEDVVYYDCPSIPESKQSNPSLSTIQEESESGSTTNALSGKVTRSPLPSLGSSPIKSDLQALFETKHSEGIPAAVSLNNGSRDMRSGSFDSTTSDLTSEETDSVDSKESEVIARNIEQLESQSDAKSMTPQQFAAWIEPRIKEFGQNQHEYISALLSAMSYEQVSNTDSSSSGVLTPPDSQSSGIKQHRSMPNLSLFSTKKFA